MKRCKLILSKINETFSNITSDIKWVTYWKFSEKKVQSNDNCNTKKIQEITQEST